MFKNKSILITGGTGSFGRALVALLLKKYEPRKIVIYSRDEQKHFDMNNDFQDGRLRYFVGDVRDRERLDMAMQGVDIVVHAAAMKHVHIAEYNPMECIKTNVDGANNVIASCIKNNVEKVIALSTDKAAAPANLYGATKLVSDKLFVAANNLVGAGRTRFAVVRYGNVMGSKGSILPFFRKLLVNNADHLPITHEEMTRFIITLEQGCNFVIDGFARMHGGEIFIPKIPSITIVDFAKAIAPQLPIKIVGIRPGEKLHEAMITENDAHLTYEFKNYYSIVPTINFSFESDYSRNALGDEGKRVDPNFEYISNINEHFLNVEEIGKMIKEIE
ncbi:MAG: UDP-N-acetylglucosamine 4,6-dehydratase (inverting) [Neisseriaceae bacterium]|nr:MAG: UDP-N-acetylglucosamine 4,6-dehydratase (inverting) [Neisseriaceae bacterium]